MSFGSTRLWVFCSIVLGMGFIASGYLNYVQFQRATSDQQQAKGVITDLRYQLGLNKPASPSPSPSPTPTPSATPDVLAAQTTPSPTPAPVTTTTKAFVYLHAQPNRNSPVKANVQAGTTVTLVASVNAEYEQVVVNGVAGFVAKSYLNL